MDVSVQRTLNIDPLGEVKNSHGKHNKQFNRTFTTLRWYVYTTKIMLYHRLDNNQVEANEYKKYKVLLVLYHSVYYNTYNNRSNRYHCCYFPKRASIHTLVFHWRK